MGPQGEWIRVWGFQPWSTKASMPQEQVHHAWEWPIDAPSQPSTKTPSTSALSQASSSQCRGCGKAARGAILIEDPVFKIDLTQLWDTSILIILFFRIIVHTFRGERIGKSAETQTLITMSE